jgi:fluoride exporter
MPVIVGVALGGALGSSARYGLDRLIERRSAAVFPLSTFTVNVTGCFLIGLVSAALVERHYLPAWLRIGLVVGVVGGYTTFSTFAQEALDLNDIHQESPSPTSSRAWASAWPRFTPVRLSGERSKRGARRSRRRLAPRRPTGARFA